MTGAMPRLCPPLLLLLAACGDPPSGRDVYGCTGGLGVSVDRGREHADLTLSTGEVARLDRKRSFPGERYTADGLIWFERGDEAVIERKGDTAYCRLVARGA